MQDLWKKRTPPPRDAECIFRWSIFSAGRQWNKKNGRALSVTSSVARSITGRIYFTAAERAGERARGEKKRKRVSNK